MTTKQRYHLDMMFGNGLITSMSSFPCPVNWNFIIALLLGTAGGWWWMLREEGVFADADRKYGSTHNSVFGRFFQKLCALACRARSAGPVLLGAALLATTATARAAEGSPYPELVRLNNAEPILDRKGAMFPSLVKIPDWVPPEKRAHPEAVYYLYWATHYGSDIHLSWSRSVQGPYVDFNSSGNKDFHYPRSGVLSFPDGNEFTFDNGVLIYAHISSPEILIDHENRLFVLFFHGPSNNDQKSFVATSPWGLNFNPANTGGIEGYGVVPQILNSQYMRLFLYDGHRYAVAMHGVLCRAPTAGPPYLIPPGTHPLQTYWDVSHTPVSGVSPRHAAARVREGRYLDYFFSRRIDNERIEVATIDMDAGPWTSWREMEPSVTLIDNTAPWEGDDTRDPAIYEENGNVYLLYSGGGENGIGLALLEGDHPLPGEPLPADYRPIRVIDWGIGRDAAKSKGDFRGTEPANLNGFVGYPFSSTEPLSPSSGYAGQPIYGGFLADGAGKMASSKVSVGSDGSSEIDLRVQDSESVHGCLYFDKKDFRGVAAETPVAFGKYSFIRLKLDRFAGPLRFLVREGDDFYVSETRITQSGELRFRSAVDDGRWAAYDPADSLDFDASEGFEKQNFSNITAVGIMLDGDSRDGDRSWLRIQEFEVGL
jgi:hypothetical protein